MINSGVDVKKTVPQSGVVKEINNPNKKNIMKQVKYNVCVTTVNLES